MPLQATSGAASYDAFGGGVPVVPNYIEDVFNTYLYKGTGATLTITNNIDMTKGYLLWFKDRSATRDHKVYDSARGVDKTLVPNTTDAQVTQTFPISVSTTGFTIPDDYDINTSNNNIVSWTFRKQPKFFDVVTFTGDGTTGRNIAHNLGSVPGCIIVKRTDSTSNWTTYHRESDVKAIALNRIDASYGTPCWGSVAPTSTVFTVSLESAASTVRQININGASYVAYLFAHDAGGFGLTGTDNVISCGSYTGNGSATGPVVTLGYEPQWLLVKQYREGGVTSNWHLLDNMRGMPVGSADARLIANLTNAEDSVIYISPTATGFNVVTSNSQINASGDTYIYIAIRRGPMKVPTLGTTVFSPIAITPSSGTVSTTNFPVDFMITTSTAGGTSRIVHDKLRGVGTVGASNARTLLTNDTTAEFAGNSVTYNWWNTGFTWGAGFAGEPMVAWNFRRAPSFFDEVCYTGTGTAGQTYTHNLGVVPELMIVKSRNDVTNWFAYSSATGNTQYLLPNSSTGVQTATSVWNNTTPTASVFTLGSSGAVNGSASTYVAYLFATCAGVSKVGSYTGNGSTQTINCGFTGGARFVLIKRTDSTGDWYTYDTARGMTTLTDPYLLLNDTGASIATLGSVTTVSTGFALNAAILAAINTNAASYIFLAIA